MQIGSIGAVSSTKNISKIGDTQKKQNGFSDILSDAVDNIKKPEAEAQVANEALLTGESDDIHTALIASQKAEIAVSYAVQIRNKVVEAYDKILNMQV